LIVIAAPFRSDTIELAVNTLALLCLGLVLGVFIPAWALAFMWHDQVMDLSSKGRCLALFFLLFLLVYFPYINRQAEAGLLEIRLSGVIGRKDQSLNHRSDSIDVRAEDGSVSRTVG